MGFWPGATVLDKVKLQSKVVLGTRLDRGVMYGKRPNTDRVYSHRQVLILIIYRGMRTHCLTSMLVSVRIWYFIVRVRSMNAIYSRLLGINY